MPVVLPEVPFEIRKAFLIGAEQAMWHNQALVTTVRDKIDETQGLPVFTLGLHVVRQGQRTNQAMLAGYRAWIRSGTEALAGDIAFPENGEPRMVRLTRGRKLREAIDAVLQTMSGTDIPAAHNYDVRLLRIPGAFIEACWLVPADGSEQFFIPSVSGLRDLNVGVLYKFDDFFKVVEDAATKAVEFGSL